MYKLNKIQYLTLTGMFGAIILLMTFTPIGFPQIPLIGSATIVHIPVIVGSILMGPKYGAILGFIFGLGSMIFASTLSLALNAFAFTPLRPVPGTDSGSPWALVIAFVPRILVGVVPWLVYVGLKNILPKKMEAINLSVSAIAGSMTNTLLVLHLMYFIFRQPWTYAREVAAAGGADIPYPEITYAFVAGVIAAFGIPEAIAAAIIAPVVCGALFVLIKRMNRG